MLAITDKVIRAIYVTVLGVLTAMGAAMLGISWTHIFCRYVLNNSLSWSEELLKILVVWFCLLSATFISLRREHVSITIFKSKMPKIVKKSMDYLVSLLTFMATISMCYIGIRLSLFVGMRKTPVLHIPNVFLYSSIWVSFGIMAIYELRNLIADIFAPGSPPAMQAPLEFTE